jgi:nucleoside-diphosphate-sugar epimerase
MEAVSLTKEPSTNVVSHVIFGAGYTLERTAELLPSDQTLLVVRTEESAAKLASRFSMVRVVDIADEASVSNLFHEFPVVQCVVDGIPPLHGSPDPLAGIKNILKFTPQSVSRFVYISTTGVFGGVDGQVVDEQSECLPIHSNGRARLDSENLYREAGCKKTILRVPGIYGPGRGTGISLSQGRYPFVEEGKRWSNRVHVEDLARIIADAVKSVAELPEVLCICDDEPALTKDVVDFYCKKFGFAQPQSITEAEAVSRRMQSILSNQKVSNQLLKKTLGFEFKYPSYREGAGTEFQDMISSLQERV